jgi:hypothetical protein
MGQRLSPADQQQVDSIWDNMLTPAQRVDRDTLLDAIVLNQLHDVGVDEIHMCSKKKLTDERVVAMEVRFARDDPAADQFTFTLKNRWGWTLRKERYTGKQVLSRIDDFGAAQTGTSPKIKADFDDRLRKVRAATQPLGATLPDE